MKKHTLNYIFGTLFLLPAIILIFSNNIDDKISAVSLISASLVIFPIFDSICNFTGKKFSDKSRIILFIGTIFLPFISITDEKLDIYNFIISIMIITIFWSYMFKIQNNTSDEINTENKLNSDKIQNQVSNEISTDDKTNSEDNDKNNNLSEISTNNESNYDNDDKDNNTAVNNNLTTEDNINDIENSENNKVSNSTVRTIDYHLPSLSLIHHKKSMNESINLELAIAQIEQTLSDFKIKGKIVSVIIGPRFTTYGLFMIGGTKLNKIESLKKEISMNLSSNVYRITPSFRENNVVDIIVYNNKVTPVYLNDVLRSVLRKNKKNEILVAIGRGIYGNDIILDLCKLPGLIVSGSTGSGLTTCLNSIFLSILILYKPSDVKLLIIDTTEIDFTNCNKIPHLISPVITEEETACNALKKILEEINNRYNVFLKNGVKNISSYNNKVENFQNSKNLNTLKKMPHIVIIISDLTYLMLSKKSYIEEIICQIAKVSKTYGIHMIIGVKNPSSAIITDSIKEKIPSRIALAVSSTLESRIILDEIGAEDIDVDGDMLYKSLDNDELVRIQGCNILDTDINKIVDYCSSQYIPDCEFNTLNYDSLYNFNESSYNNSNDNILDDKLYNEIVEFVIESQKVSTSLLQKKFKLGYNRAARIIDLLEERGIIGPSNGSNSREVLIKLDNNTLHENSK